MILQLLKLDLDLATEPGESSRPALVAPDHRGVDEELLPAPGRPEASRGRGRLFGLGDLLRLGEEIQLHWLGVRGARRHLVLRRNPEDVFAIGQLFRRYRHTVGVESGKLGKRKVFCEARCAELLGGAIHQCEERAACRVRLFGTTFEIGGNLGALERVLEKPRVALGRAEEDGHLVETDTLGGLGVNGARNLDRLLGLAGRGENDDVGSGLADGRRFVAEDVALQIAYGGAAGWA